MNYDIMTIIIWFAVWLGICAICGVGSSNAGGGFMWGFLFGPVGIVVAAIIAQGEQTRRAAVLAAKPVSAATIGAKRHTAARSLTAECKYCRHKMTDIPGPGTYECPDCGQYIEVD